MRELTLDELRLVSNLTWPEVQSDLDANKVEEVPEVEVFFRGRALEEGAGPYAYRRTATHVPRPLAPGVSALPGRHRARVLPLSGVAVALSPLDDDLSYLRAHRRELFALQDVSAADLVPLEMLRRADAREFAYTPLMPVHAFVGWLLNGRVRGYYEGRFRRSRSPHGYDDPFAACFAVRSRLVPGTLYRLRPTRTWRPVVEVVLPEGEPETIGPYR